MRGCDLQSLSLRAAEERRRRRRAARLEEWLSEFFNQAAGPREQGGSRHFAGRPEGAGSEGGLKMGRTSQTGGSRLLYGYRKVGATIAAVTDEFVFPAGLRLCCAFLA